MKAKREIAPKVEAPRAKFTLGDKEYEVVPFSTLEDSYDKITDFSVLAAPLFLKIASMIEGGSVLETLSSMTSVLSQINLPSLLRDFKEEIPELVAFVCQNTEPDMTAERVKKLSKTPYNAELFKAVFYQVKADNLIEQFVSLANDLSAIAGSAQ